MYLFAAFLNFFEISYKNPDFFVYILPLRNAYVNRKPVAVVILVTYYVVRPTKRVAQPINEKRIYSHRAHLYPRLAVRLSTGAGTEMHTPPRFASHSETVGCREMNTIVLLI